MTENHNDYFYWLRDDYLNVLLDTARPTTRDKPSWFDRKKYAPLKGAIKKCWYEQLLIRKAIIYSLSVEQKDLYIKDFSSYLIEQTRKHTIVDIKDTKLQFLIGGAELVTMKSKDEERKKFAHSVQRLTPLGAIHRLLNLPPKSRTHAFKSVEEYFYGCASFTDFYSTIDLDNTMMQPLDNFQNDRMLNMQIDPYAPLESIISQVRSIVQTEQRKLKKPQMFSSEKNYDLGVLHFLDLAIWAMERNRRIPYSEIATLIYDENAEENLFKGERHVEQTTAPKAIAMLHSEYLRRLHREIYS